MRLLELELKDFRQYYGQQKIELGNLDEKNITIILGENGEGKTGLFRAVIFCLFGQIYINEEESNISRDGKDKDIIHIVNFNKLEENIGEPVTTYIRLKFEHEGYIYDLKRSKLEMKDDDGEIICDTPLEVELFITKPDGNTEIKSIVNDMEVQDIISNIMDKKLKDFFLFDGEKIENLTKPKKETREEVKKGILRLLQIDSITTSIEILQGLERTQNQKIRKMSSNTKLNSKQDEKDEIIKKIENQENDIDIIEGNIRNYQQEKEEIEIKLAKDTDIQELMEKRAQKVKEKNEKKRLLLEIKNGAKKFIPEQGHNIVLDDYILKTKNFLGQEIIGKEYSSDISIELLEKILKDKTCICGNKFEKDSESYEIISDLIKQYSRSELSSFINIFRSRIRDYYDNRQDYMNDMENILEKIRDVEDEIEELNIELKRINDTIDEKSQSEENLKYLKEQHGEIKKKEEEAKIQLKIAEKTFENLKNEKAKLQDEIDKLLKEEASLRVENSKLNYIRDLKNNFEKILADYSQEMREKISSEATYLFKNMISEKDKNLIERIDITDNYEIKVKGWNDSAMTSDISAGQRQVVSLAFVIALAKAASNSNKKMNIPLFMDTPFGRISGENRDNLIRIIPNFTVQWILLMTDTEFTSAEEVQFKRTEKIGSIYRLKQVSAGYTKIEKIENLDEKLSRR